MNWSDYFYYDVSSPSGLRWAVDVYVGKNTQQLRMKIGDVAGTEVTRGYWQVKVRSKRYVVSRVIWEMHKGKIPEGMLVDHIDRNTSNNSIENLRVVTPKVNPRNAKRSKSNKTGVTGVSKIENRLYCSSWKEMSGKLKQKYFQISEHGEEGAFRLACEHRARMIQELNAQGAGYTEAHGT